MHRCLQTLVMLCLMLAATPASAHATLLASSPSAGATVARLPHAVSLTFSEPVAPASLTLVDPDGRVLELKGEGAGSRVLVSLPNGKAEGTHLICWRVVSADGHPVSGTIALSVGGATRPASGRPAASSLDTAIWAATALTYVGLFFGLGGTLFLAAVASSTAAGPIVWAPLAVGSLAAAISVPLQGLDLTGKAWPEFLEPAVTLAAMNTSHGIFVALCLLAAGLAAIAAALRNRVRRLLSLLALGTLSAAVISSGHVVTAEPALLARTALVVHVLGFVLWIGALPWLAIHLVRDPKSVARDLAVFSRMIVWPVAAVLVSGIVLAAMQLGAPGPAWLAPYGMVLAAKLVLVAGLFAIAAWNRWKLTPPALAGEIGAQRTLRGLIVAEIVLVVAIMGLAAGWRFTPPPRELEVEAATLTTHLHGSGLMAELSLSDPHRGGPAVVTFFPQQEPAIPPRSVALSLYVPSEGGAPLRLPAQARDDGTWTVDVPPLPVAGRWKVKVDVRLTEFDLVSLPGTVLVK